ncbi:uncharacterized protein LOC100604804 [Nomascus leucogenys]|uniref:uncharacterized protein LOC100604804 n=1 Tax=Nomascus leucogenys TaxID=61853 RepID=UPI00122DA626|nr:uncharacterized protein LOC100604804 [Nomascus leucogenys]
MRLSRSLPSTTRVATSTATRGHTGDRDSRVCAHADAPICTRTGALRGPGLLTAGLLPRTPANPPDLPRDPPPRSPPTRAHSSSPEGPSRVGPPEGAASVSRLSARVRGLAEQSTPAGFCFHLLILQSTASYLAYEGLDLRKPSWITAARKRKNATPRRFQ